jgi:hypothetical protein
VTGLVPVVGLVDEVHEDVNDGVEELHYGRKFRTIQ